MWSVKPHLIQTSSHIGVPKISSEITLSFRVQKFPLFRKIYEADV